MRKLWILLPMILLLTACSQAKTLETVSDPVEITVLPEPQQIILELPEGANAPVLQSDTAGKVYMHDDYVISVQTLEGGDLDRTLLSCSGFTRNQMALMQTQQKDAKRYDGVFVAAGEGAQQVGRICVLDDGDYHYVVTMMTDDSHAGKLQETIQNVFSSIRLIPADVDLNTGS